jgi:hypothetical protein
MPELAQSALDRTATPQELQGRRFYPPGVIATYCILSLPVGLCLYGLNIARRGGRVMGYGMAGISVITFGGTFAAGAMGATVSMVSIVSTLPIFVAIGLLNMEDPPYRAALSRGGVKARWWPPLLWVIGSLLVGTIVVTFFGPEVVVE